MSNAASSLWSDSRPVEYIDRDAVLYMGADPCWTPDREQQQTGEDADHCPLCLGVGHFDDEAAEAGILHFVQSRVRVGSHLVCARCMRYGLDHRIEGHETKRGRPYPVPCLPPSATSPEDAESEDDETILDAGPGYVKRGRVTIPNKFAHRFKRR